MAGLTRQQAVQEFGTTGLKRFGGYVQEEFLRELQGSRGAKTFRQMADNDPTIGAMLFGLEQVIQSASWRTEPASSAKADEDAAAFIDGCRGDLSQTWEDLITDVCSMFPYGWAYFETVYKQRGGDVTDPSKRSQFDDGRIGWRKFTLIAQETLYDWQFDDHGGIQGLRQVAAPDYQTRVVPIEKALLFRTRTSRGNPEGRSLLRNAYRPWYFKTRIEEVEGIGVERDLAGLPVLYTPSGINPDEYSKAKQLVRNIRRDEQEGVVIKGKKAADGSGYSLELLTTGGRRQFDTSAIVNRYDRRIAMSVLMQFILLGMEQVGTQALAGELKSVWLLSVQGWLKAIAAVLNRFAVQPLIRLTAFPGATGFPRLVPGDVTTPTLAELAEYVNKLADKQLIAPNDALETYLLERAGLPVPPKEATPGRPVAKRAGEVAGDGQREYGIVDILG